MLDSGFSKANAEFFSELSMNAYLGVSEFSDIYSDNFDIKFFDSGSTQCYALWDDNDLIYAFRGTEPKKLSDIKTDIRFRKTEASEDSSGRVHRGFKDGLDLIWDDLLDHFEYTHVGHLNYFDRKGNHVHGFSRWYMFKQYIIGMLVGLKNFEIDSFWDHSSVKYHKLCEKFNSRE